ncbi:MAG: 30S ribosomal protein S6 [Solirubrobacterales bacterium]
MPPNASYDLMVLLDPEAAEDARAGVLERIKGQIQSGDATLKGDADWGMRRLAYEIDNRSEAQYHLFQFEASPAVLNELGRTLSIDDIVLRFRTIRLPGEAPDETPPAPPHVAPEIRRRDDRGRRESSDRGRSSSERSAPSRAEDAPETAPAEEVPAGDAGGEPTADPGASTGADAGGEPTAV